MSSHALHSLSSVPDTGVAFYILHFVFFIVFFRAMYQAGLGHGLSRERT